MTTKYDVERVIEFEQEADPRVEYFSLAPDDRLENPEFYASSLFMQKNEINLPDLTTEFGKKLSELSTPLDPNLLRVELMIANRDNRLPTSIVIEQLGQELADVEHLTNEETNDAWQNEASFAILVINNASAKLGATYHKGTGKHRRAVRHPGDRIGAFTAADVQAANMSPFRSNDTFFE